MTGNQDLSSPSYEDDEMYAQIPANFPRPVNMGAVPGAQKKFLASEYRGRYYSPGCTPPELFERWQICEDIATQLAEKSISSKASHRAHMSEIEILEQYLPRLIAQGWTSETESRYVIRRVAEIAGWQMPAAAMD